MQTPKPFTIKTDEHDSGCFMCVVCGWHTCHQATECGNDSCEAFYSVVALTAALWAGIVTDSTFDFDFIRYDLRKEAAH